MAEQSETGSTPLVKILGKHGSALGYAIRDFLYRSGVPFQWVQLSTCRDYSPPVTCAITQ